MWHSRDKYRRVVFQCNDKYGAGKRCATPHVTEEALKRAFVAALNQMITDREAVIADISLLLPKLADTASLERDKELALQERDELRNLLERCVEQNARTTMDQKVYQERYKGLTSRYEAAQATFAGVTDKIQQREHRCETLRRFITELETRPEPIKLFDETAWRSLADQVTITADGGAVFRFKNGMESRVGLRA